jgi:hypothetical protein
MPPWISSNSRFRPYQVGSFDWFATVPNGRDEVESYVCALLTAVEANETIALVQSRVRDDKVVGVTPAPRAQRELIRASDCRPTTASRRWSGRDTNPEAGVAARLRPRARHCVWQAARSARR